MKGILKIAVYIFILFSSQITFSQQKKYSLFLIGDAGQPVLSGNGLKELIQSNFDPNTPSAFIFLGDNIYDKGMPERGHKDRAETEQIILNQVDLVKAFNSPTYFIPGNHDWKKGRNKGWQQIVNQQQFIDSLRLGNISFQPVGGCPGPVEIELTSELVLVIIDSQWFLHPWDKPQGEDSSCEVKTPEDAVIQLKDILERNINRKVVVAAHHPVYTFGEHNGVFLFKEHIFPLRDLNPHFYIPLPVLGSIYPLYRKFFGNIQDNPHPLNKRYREMIHNTLKDFPGTIYASGHEHALQYSISDSIHYVVSGSGVKNTFVKKKKPAEYVSGETGFARVDLFDDLSSKITFFEVKKAGQTYTNVVPPAQHLKKEENPEKEIDFTKSVSVKASERYHANDFRQWLLGENYRLEWKQPLEVLPINLASEHGGLTPIQKGGGMQTLSLRLVDSAENEFTLRSVEKYPEKAVPEVFKETFAQDLVEDQISASHPYGALVVPYLAEAARIFHTNPKLVFIPNDSHLGIYQKEFANSLALFEERPDGNAKDKPHFGNAAKIISTDKVLEKLSDDHDNQVDQSFVVRSRLFDLVIGDWDRHDDQWRWAVFKHKKSETYRPIPRDRDQAFFVSEGFLAKLWSRKWALPKFEGFHDEVRWTPGFMFNARYFDRSFLNEIEYPAWQKEVSAIKNNLTDDAIESSVRKFPEQIFQIHGNEIIRKLKSRRDHLQTYALEYYRFLAREVDIPSSNKDESFSIHHEPNGDLTVNVLKLNKKRQLSDTLYHRTFNPDETTEVRLFGLGGDDVFKLTGNGKESIRVRIIGGEGADSLVNASDLRVAFYDNLKGATLTGKKIKDRTSTDPDVNDYNRKAYRYARLAPLLYGNFNYDDGLFLGGGFHYTNHGFRKDPYKSRHIFLASYAPLTGSYNFRYDGSHQQVFGKWGIETEADLKAPNFVNNFFGWGNETEFNSDLDDEPGYDDLERSIDYYRLRLQEIDLRLKMIRPLGGKGYFKAGPVFQRVEIEKPKGNQNLIYEFAQTVDEPVIENPKNFAGIVTEWNADQRDSELLTQRGVILKQRSVFMKGLDSDATDFTSHSGSLSFYQSFRLPAHVTYAIRFGGGFNTGEYEIYQAQILDGKTELRGYRKTRFYGDKRFFSNNEIRVKLTSFRSYLFPATLGLNGFYDIGRVWYEDSNGNDPSAEDGHSDKWHSGFGGGIWFTPFNITVLSTEFAHSADGNMIYVRLGFLF